MTVTGRVSTQASWRVEDSNSGGRDCFYSGGSPCSGFTFPDTDAGDLIQHRTLIDLEFFHDVDRWLAGHLVFLDNLSYRVRVKYFYDGVYDYGPDTFSEPSEHLTPQGTPDVTGQRGLRAARHQAHQHDPLWNAYVDARKGRLNVRVGRQDLSWGETDGFRLLDMIEPLDNRFGFPLVEDLDDRRIPLWMVRGSLEIGNLGLVEDVTLDTFWVPGSIDNQETPAAAVGNPFSLANPPGESIIKVPSKKMENSRGGGRLLGQFFDRWVQVSLAHYVTFNDVPSARLLVRNVTFVPVPGGNLLAPDSAFLLEYYQQQITGITASGALPFDPLTIVRLEAANFWDERVFTAQDSVASAVNRFIQTGRESRGGLPTRNTVRWMVGADRNFWLRFLNPKNTFFASVQFFHTHIVDYDKSIANAVASSTTIDQIAPESFAGNFHFVPRKEDEMTVTYLVNSLFWQGNLQPQIFGSYDSRGVHSIVPQITYNYGTNLQFVFKYAMTTGTYANLGFFGDRDQVLFRVQYNLS